MKRNSAPPSATSAVAKRGGVTVPGTAAVAPVGGGMQKPIRFSLTGKSVAVALVVAALLVFLLSVRSVLTPFATAVVVAYALGAGVPMLGIAYGGRWIARRLRHVSPRAGAAQRAFGVAMVVTALAMAANVDRSVTVWAVSALPAGWSTPLGALESSATARRALASLRQQDQAQASPAVGQPPVGRPVGDGRQAAAAALAPTPPALQDLGRAAGFSGITRWFNTPRPLTLAGLRGKVVLVDFWTYSCINCLRALPHVIGWYARYQKLGFVVVGVHTPEFAFEGVPANVAQAIRQLHITYPVALDPRYATWNAYNNQYWPAEYLIDARGVIRHVSFGEGEYGATEQAIRRLLRDAGRPAAMPLAAAPDLTPRHPRTPETYMGSDRMSSFASPQPVTPGRVEEYTTPRLLAGDAWALAGRWRITPTQAAAVRAGDSLDFQITGSKVFVVLAPRGRDDRVRVYLDGRPPTAGTGAGADVHDGVVRVTMDNLYNVVDLGGRVESHRLRLVFETPGTAVYSFTFG
ncbi:MAG: hypothetical protein NVSMB65_14480 [Chloroflexota bacterium]